MHRGHKKRELTDPMGISLVLPVHNEERHIAEMIEESVKALEDIGRDFEIIIVDDGSTDGTPVQIERAASHLPHTSVLTLRENLGKGNALMRGFRASTMELVCFMDADLDLHPWHLGVLLDEMERSGADIVIGSKRHPDSKLEYPWYRKLYSTAYYLLILLLFRLPVRDTQTGVKLFHRQVLQATMPHLLGKKYTLDLEILVVAHHHGYEVAEAPIKLTFQGKYGRIKWKDIMNIIIDTMAIFYRLYVKRYYDKPVEGNANAGPP